jgi:hypothetical protein
MASFLSSYQLVGETLCYMNYADKEIFDELCLRAKLGGLRLTAATLASKFGSPAFSLATLSNPSCMARCANLAGVAALACSASILAFSNRAPIFSCNSRSASSARTRWSAADSSDHLGMYASAIERSCSGRSSIERSNHLASFRAISPSVGMFALNVICIAHSFKCSCIWVPRQPGEGTRFSPRRDRRGKTWSGGELLQRLDVGFRQLLGLPQIPLALHP